MEERASMFHLPTLQPCDGMPVWLMADDDLTEALVLWWPSGTAWVVHGASTTPDDNHLDAA
jgi:hypothetical protein